MVNIPPHDIMWNQSSLWQLGIPLIDDLLPMSRQGSQFAVSSRPASQKHGVNSHTLGKYSVFYSGDLMFKSYPVSEDELTNFMLGLMAAKMIGCILDETGIANLEIYKFLYPLIYVYGLIVLMQTLCRWLS